MVIKNNITYFLTRKEPEKFERVICVGKESYVTNNKKAVSYEYYICDYCNAEIKILDKKHEMEGGIIEIPQTINKRGKLKLALHNKCLIPVLKELEEQNDIRN